MRFDDFAETANELFGLTENEAADLANDLERAGWDIADVPVNDPDMWEVASDLLEDFFEEVSEEEYSPYDLDPYWPDDDYLDAGEEWEIAPDYEDVS